jgi:hypothetical protein
MKNKLMLLLLIGFVFSGCSQPSDASDIDSRGRVYIVGNDPVTQAVYRDNSGQYQIDNCYKNLSGRLIHVTGNITGTGMYGQYLDILSVEIIN